MQHTNHPATELTACVAMYAARIEIKRLDTLQSDSLASKNARHDLAQAEAAFQCGDYQTARDRALDCLFRLIPSSPHYQRAVAGCPVYGEPATCYESLRTQSSLPT